MQRSLPLVGPITYYLPIKGKRPCLDGLKGEWRLIAEAELRMVRGEFAGMDRFYERIRKDGRNFLTAAGTALFGAVGTDDSQLFDSVLKDIAAYPSRYGTPEAKLAVEIVMVWVNDFLHASVRCPDWLVHLDLAAVPGEWRRQVAYLAVKCLYRRNECVAAAVLADALLNLESDKTVGSSAADIYLKMAKAKICRHEGRMHESERWCRAVVESARPLGIVLPFLGAMLGPKSVMERALSEGAPELLAKIRRLTGGYFRNLAKYHNRFTGDSVAEILSPREFFLAQSLKQGLRYKEIAERMGIAPGRVHNMVGMLYETLGIDGREEIADLVW